MSLRPLVKQFLRCEVKNGQLASFWYDHWTPFGPLIDFIGDHGLRKLGINRNAIVADTFTTDNLWSLPSSRSRDQNVIYLRNWMLNNDPPSAYMSMDAFSWCTYRCTCTTFRTSGTWEALRPCGRKKSWMNLVWFKQSVPKHAFTFWVANIDRLPLRPKLHRWGLNVSRMCVMCNLHEESRNHLFFTCNFAIHIWRKILFRLGCPQVLLQDWQGMIIWLKARNTIKGKILKKLVAQATVYTIWRERNNRIHNNINSPEVLIFSQLDRSIRDILLARLNRKNCSKLLSLWFTHV